MHRLFSILSEFIGFATLAINIINPKQALILWNNIWSFGASIANQRGYRDIEKSLGIHSSSLDTIRNTGVIGKKGY